MNESRSPHIGTGIVLLVVIFSALCMSVLSLLSWQTAKNEQTLAERAGAAAQAYYSADAAAQHVRRALEEEKLDAFGEVAVSWNENEASYRCPISEVLALDVVLRVADDKSTVLRWATVSQTDWQADEKIEVWNGD